MGCARLTAEAIGMGMRGRCAIGAWGRDGGKSSRRTGLFGRIVRGGYGFTPIMTAEALKKAVAVAPVVSPRFVALSLVMMAARLAPLPTSRTTSTFTGPSMSLVTVPHRVLRALILMSCISVPMMMLLALMMANASFPAASPRFSALELVMIAATAAPRQDRPLC